MIAYSIQEINGNSNRLIGFSHRRGKSKHISGGKCQVLSGVRHGLRQRHQLWVDGEDAAHTGLIDCGGGQLAAAYQCCHRYAQPFGPASNAYDHLAPETLAVQPSLAGDDQVRIRRQPVKIHQFQHRLNTHLQLSSQKAALPAPKPPAAPPPGRASRLLPRSLSITSAR